MKAYLLYLGSLTLLSVGLPLLYLLHMYQRYNRNVRTVKEMRRRAKALALAVVT